MAKFCSEQCKQTGSICDFCKHYRDDYEGLDTGFAGSGKCDIDNSETNASDGYNCDNFECFNLQEANK